MSQRLRVLLGLLTVLLDMIMASVAFYLAYKLRALLPYPTPLHLALFRRYWGQLVIHVFALVSTFFAFKLYHVQRGRSRVDLLYSILSAVSIATVFATALIFLIYRDDGDITRGLIIYNWILAIFSLTLGRILIGYVRRYIQRRSPDRLLLVGTGDIARMILQKTLQSPQLGYQVIGFVDGKDKGEIAGIPILGSRAELATILSDYDVHEVVITLLDASHDELLDIISTCESAHASVRIFPDLFQIIASELSINDLDGLPLLTVRDATLHGWKLTVKRAMDVVLSGLGLIFLSPFMLLVALAIKLESKGPVFYVQTRVGLDSKPFETLKLRTMRADAEKETGPVWATADVLLGDMSLVGPRPERPIFVEQFKQVVPRYMERHKEKAGLTGWAQVNGLRGDTSIVERTKYDLYYIENWSLLFDLKIILRTIFNQFRSDRNAY